MRKSKSQTVGRFVSLMLVTVFAIAVMLASGTKFWKPETSPEDSAESAKAIAAAPVVVRQVAAESIEILDTYSGMIRPFERFRLALEIAGRVIELGQNQQQQPLDDGDIVAKGHVLAVLDQRILQARRQETSARLEQAQDDLRRAKDLLARGNQAITEADYQRRVTDFTIAKAQAATAEKNIEDATLRSPCDGVIAKRLINPGESINAQQTVFEVVQVDRVILMLGVPESRIQEIAQRRRVVANNQNDTQRAGELGQPSPMADQDLSFDVHVQLLGKDRFGRAWPPREGVVYRISETADDKTGLFEVEVLLDNQDRSLRPGLVALAEIVIDRMQGYRIPIESALFRGGRPYVFSVANDHTDSEYMVGKLGPAEKYRVQRFELNKYIEQAGTLILPELPPPHRLVVTRGQNRLVDGQFVRIVGQSGSGEAAETGIASDPLGSPSSLSAVTE